MSCERPGHAAHCAPHAGPVAMGGAVKRRDFVVEYGESRSGPWSLFRVVKNLRVGAGAVPTAELCRATHNMWTRIRRADRNSAWRVWGPR